jgi:cobalt-zinc-cadmium efflux system outer membrane protein
MVNAMASSPFELLQAKREQLRTASLYIDALRDYWIARAELDLLLAGRLVNVAPLAGATAARAGRASH